MSSKVAVSRKVVKNDQIKNIFNKMIGGDVEFTMAYPKYRELLGGIQAIVNVLSVIPGMRHTDSFKTIRSKVPLGNHVFTATLEEEGTGMINKARLSDFVVKYRTLLRKSKIMKEFLDAKSYLKDYRSEILKLDLGYLGSQISFRPFPSYLDPDFATLYNESIGKPAEIRFVGQLILRLSNELDNLYNIWIKPDVSIDDFVSGITSSLDNIKRQVTRCDRAIDTIKSSVRILNSKFPTYYEEFMLSNNPNIIFENFILDAGKACQADKELTAQFRKIVSYCQNLAEQKDVKDAQCMTLLSAANVQLEEWDKNL